MAPPQKKATPSTVEATARRETLHTDKGNEVVPSLGLLQRAIQNPTPRTLTPTVVQRLQQQYGNRFVAQLIQRVTAFGEKADRDNQYLQSSQSLPDTSILPTKIPIQRRFKYKGDKTIEIAQKEELEREDSSSKPKDISSKKRNIDSSGFDRHKMRKSEVVEYKDVWEDGEKEPYQLDQDKVEKGSQGVKLGFKPLPMGDSQEFIVPKKIGVQTYKSITADKVQYNDPEGMNSDLELQDLNLVTGYKESSAKSSFPALSKYDSHFHRTSSLSRVSLIPLKSSKGDELFKVSEIWVQEVKISNDRPPTKFGKVGQKSHTVAWTLLRAGLQGMGNQTLENFLNTLKAMAKDLDLPTNSKESTEAATAVQTRLNEGIKEIGDSEKASDIFFWQRLASDFVGQYVHLYQLSEAATYDDGKAVGHGEPTHMETLREAESLLGQKKDIPKLEPVTTAALKMLDYKERLGDKVIARIVHHWINNLALAFPLLVKAHHEALIKALKLKSSVLTALPKDPTKLLDTVKNKPITESVSTDKAMDNTALDKRTSTFVANVYIVPEKSVARRKIKVEHSDHLGTKAQTTLGLGHYELEDLKIEELAIADDRPPTRFGHLQRSHTVAWTLVRRHLKNFSGKSAAILVEFIKEELPILQQGIESQKENPNISFDAPNAAKTLHTNLTDLAENSDGYPLYQWQTRLSELVESYITLYQLSRATTYAKEERPQGHGESDAINDLDKVELHLLSLLTLKEREEYTTTNKKDICDNAIKLVDAVVATSTLQPTEWQSAIEHWLKLLKGKYPTLMSISSMEEAIQNSIKIAEPKEETLTGYKSELTKREKILVNIYVMVENEAKYIPTQIQKDVNSRLVSHLSLLDGPTIGKWPMVVKGTELTEPQLRDLNQKLAGYQGRGGGRRSSKKDVPEESAISSVTSDIKKYYNAIKKAKPSLLEILFNSIKRRANDTKSGEFVSENAELIQKTLMEAIDETLELSGLETIDNYQSWYKIIHKIGTDDEVNYENIMKSINSLKPKEK